MKIINALAEHRPFSYVQWLEEDRVMSEVYFDILPHSSGWVCLVNGRQQARYSSFHLAESAGRRFAATPGTGRRVVLRRLDLAGRLQPMSDEPEQWTKRR